MRKKIKGIIFDMDGTLTVPLLDFKQIRKELNVEPGGDLAEIINSWPEPRRKKAWAIVGKHELHALAHNCLQPGVENALKRFAEAGIRLAVITRNTLRSTEVLLKKLPVTFHPVLTREFPHLKPAPEPVIHILENWDIEPDECIMVGDYIHDIESANAAGAVSCFFKNPDSAQWDEHADFTVNTYRELENLIFDGC